MLRGREKIVEEVSFEEKAVRGWVGLEGGKVQLRWRLMERGVESEGYKKEGFFFPWWMLRG